MSNNVEGKSSYKLAGFEFRQEGRLTRAFAKFCGKDEDPENLPTHKYHPVLRQEVEAFYPTLSSGAIAAMITGESKNDKFLNSLGLAADFTQDQWVDILRQLSNAADAFEKQRQQPVFVPVARPQP